MKIFVIGKGGREDAIAWKILQSPKLDKLYVTSGFERGEKVENVKLNNPNDIKELLIFAKRKDINLTVVGSEELLALGIVDIFQRAELKIFGPTKKAAKIEWSKSFGKKLMSDVGIANAPHKMFWQYENAVKNIREYEPPFVIKANGLAKGKAVYICKTVKEAEEALDILMVKRVYGDAGKCVIIERFLEGDEISIHAFCNGLDCIMFPPARDYKKVFDGDKGPNTGGMGGYAPAELTSGLTLDSIKRDTIGPILRYLNNKRSPFSGLIYPGLMLTNEGPMALEFNARFGNPEAQVYMPLLKTDIVDIFEAIALWKLSEIKIEWHEGYSVCVNLVSEGYPGSYKTGFPITGIDKANLIPGVIVFHAGTRCDGNQIVTDGGRVLSIVGKGDNLEEARRLVYIGVNIVNFEGKRYRKDIADKGT